MDYYLLKGKIPRARKRSDSYFRSGLTSLFTWYCDVSYTIIFNNFETNEYDPSPLLSELGANFMDRCEFSINWTVNLTDEIYWRNYCLFERTGMHYSEIFTYGISFNDSLLLIKENFCVRSNRFFWDHKSPYEYNIVRFKNIHFA